MRILFALLCSLALAFAASGAQQEKKKPAPTKRTAPAARVSRPAGKPAQVQRATKPAKPATTTARQAQVQRATKPGKPATTTGRQAQVQRVTKPGKPANTQAGRATVSRNAAAKPYKARHFNLATNTRPTNFAAVNFQQGRRIQG